MNISGAIIAVILGLTSLTVWANSDKPWQVIHSDDFGPAFGGPAATSSPPSVVTPASQTGLTPVEQASSRMHPQLAAQYLDSARWNQRREDYDAMVSNLRSAANYASAGAHYELARLHTEGVHLPVSIDQASVHLNAAAALGHAEAQRVLGRMYLRGDFGSPDQSRGLALMREAAESSVRAKRELGMWYLGMFDGLAKDRERGVGLLQDAIALGDEEALKQLNAVMDRPTAIREPLGGDVPVETGYGVEQIQPAQLPPRPPAQALFDRANSIMLRPQNQRLLPDEALAYAMFKLAYEQGHEMSGRELNYLDGIRTIMNREDPEWLETYTFKALNEFGYRPD